MWLKNAGTCLQTHEVILARQVIFLNVIVSQLELSGSGQNAPSSKKFKNFPCLKSRYFASEIVISSQKSEY